MNESLRLNDCIMMLRFIIILTLSTRVNVLLRLLSLVETCPRANATTCVKVIIGVTLLCFHGDW